MAGPGTTSDAAERLLAWYERHGRTLPWRVGPPARAAGARPDPYRVWLSEIMLQQTTVAAVGPYFADFLGRWPTLADLAAADEHEVMKAWAGLGYYARARNLLACARAVAETHGGRFPTTAAALAELPGIGPYTSAAIAALAFDEPVAVVDGNVERVMTRRLAIDEPLPGVKATIRDRLSEFVPAERPGEFAEAMMDLGATICTPKRPACALCPWDGDCRARKAGDMERYPVKAEKAARPARHGTAFVTVRADGAVLLRRRAPKGLLGGMAEVPSTEWAETAPAPRPPFPASWREAGAASHTFTHFHLELAVWRADVGEIAVMPAGAWWSPPEALGGEALPTVMKKAIVAAAPELAPALRRRR
ncbi:MAG TPA: A/G-specific adenine glycosylase [Kaistiaceae bacterium]|nr:A/G-specific adenine glycosylase [Kaistiaceae bacterium]